MSCCLRLPPPLAPPPRVVVEVLEEAWAISSNLGNWGMAAEDGPCLSRRSVPLRSMFDPSRHRRWPHRGGSLLLANPPQSSGAASSASRSRGVVLWHVLNRDSQARLNVREGGKDVVEHLFGRRLVPIARRCDLVPTAVILGEVVVEAAIFRAERDAVLGVAQRHSRPLCLLRCCANGT